MTARHLEMLITVMDCSKVSRAAEKLYITQPSVSQTIRKPENYYRVRLSERLPKQLYLTDKRRTLLSYVRYIVDSFEDMELTMKSKGSIGRLCIGASVSVGICLLREELDCLETKLPGIRTEITVYNTPVIEEMVLKNKPGVGLVGGFADSGDVVRIPFYEGELVIMMGRSHPLYGQKDLTLFCLNGRNYISRETESAEKNQLEQIPDVKEVNLKRIWSYTSTEAIKNTVMEGRGFIILSKMIVKKEAVEGSPQVTLEENSMKHGIQPIYHKDKYLSEELKTSLDICQD